MGLKPKTKKFSYIPENPENDDLVAVFDLDLVKYTAASVGEKRSIIVTPKVGKNRKPREYRNRTEFWGRGKKVGGVLGEINEKREAKGLPLFTKDHFDIEDIQEPEPLENLLHTAKLMIKGALEALGTSKVEFYLGKGDSFRVGQSTLMEYKGNRKNLLKPVYLKEMTDYLIDVYKPTVVENIEADDAVVMRAYGDPNAVVVGVDKDYRGCPIQYFDINNPDEGIINGDCFGNLIWNPDKKKVKGYGRLFLYWQMLAGDSSDNYKAACASDRTLGDKGAFDCLIDCKDDVEAIFAVELKFQDLYPEPKQIKTWHGDHVTIDWMYVLKEQFLMARMLRFNNDFLSWEQWKEMWSGVK